GRSTAIIGQSRPRPSRVSMFLLMLPEPMIWLSTERGIRRRNTVMSGHLPRFAPVGRPIKTAVGYGYRPGAGRGWMPLRGASRHFTTVAGLIMGPDGVGCRDHGTYARCMRLRSLPGWEARVPMCLSQSVA